MNKSKCKTLKFTIRIEAYFSYIQYKANRQTAYAFYATILSVIIATALLWGPTPLMQSSLSGRGNLHAQFFRIIVAVISHTMISAPIDVTRFKGAVSVI